MLKKIIERYRAKRMMRQVAELQRQLDLESEKLTVNLGDLLNRLAVHAIVIVENADSEAEQAVNELLKEQNINKN